MRYGGTARWANGRALASLMALLAMLSAAACSSLDSRVLQPPPPGPTTLAIGAIGAPPNADAGKPAADTPRPKGRGKPSALDRPDDEEQRLVRRFRRALIAKLEAAKSFQAILSPLPAAATLTPTGASAAPSGASAALTDSSAAPTDSSVALTDSSAALSDSPVEPTAASGLPTTGAATMLILSGRFSDLDPGSDALRFLIGGSAGEPSARGQFEVRDGTGRVLLVIDEVAGGWGRAYSSQLNTVDIDQLVDRLASRTAQAVIAWKKTAPDASRAAEKSGAPDGDARLRASR